MASYWFLSLNVRSGILGQAQDAGSKPLEEEKSTCALILSGIIEVLLNAIATELEKATDIKKVDLEKEITEFVDLHDSLDKDTCTSRQNNGIRRGNLRTATQDIPNNIDSGHIKFTQGRIPFLATSSIYQLLQTALKLYNTDCSNTVGASQNRSQLSMGNSSKYCSKIISFALNAFLRLLKSLSVTGTENSLKTLIYGDIKMLGPQLLKLIFLLKSVPKFATDQKKKEAKGEKNDEDRRENLHLALICIKELIMVSLWSSNLTGLLEEMVSVSPLECPGSDDDCEAATRIDDQQIRSKELFIRKILMPLFSECLALSYFGEVEVNALLPSSFQLCIVLINFYWFAALLVCLFIRSTNSFKTLYCSQIICDMILMIGNKLPYKWKNIHGAWAVRVGKRNHITNSKVVKGIVTVALSLSLPPNDLIVAQDMASELLKVTGSETIDPIEMSESYPVVNHSTNAAINSCILQLIEAILVDMDWTTKKLKIFSLVTQRSINLNKSGEHAPGLAFEENLYTRAEAVVKVLSFFVLMSLKGRYAV